MWYDIFMLTFLLLGLIPWLIISGWVALSGLWAVSSFFIDMSGSKDPVADLGIAVILLGLYPILVLVFAIIRNKISESVKKRIFIAAWVVLVTALFFVYNFHLQANNLVQQKNATQAKLFTAASSDYVCTRDGKAVDFIRLNKISGGETAAYIRVNAQGGFTSGVLGEVANDSMVLTWNGSLGINNEHKTLIQQQTYLAGCRNESGVRFGDTYSISGE